MPRPKYFTPNEVSFHNTMPWRLVGVILVYDLTLLVNYFKGELLDEFDISHWFELKTTFIRAHLNPLSDCMMYYTPRGSSVHMSSPCSSTDWTNDFGQPWWRDTQYEVGLFCQDHQHPHIPGAYAGGQISLFRLGRMSCIDHKKLHVSTWKHNCVNRDISRTLEENGILDKDEDFYSGRMDRDLFSQSIGLYSMSCIDFQEDLIQNCN
uniref:Cytochrome b5 domain containing 1 n=1 Tax=Salmo trutta TaxID=8032 RepID=A0A674BK57_SALTR